MNFVRDDDGDESENFVEAFVCCVCRDLLYKPVVLACGHISCFWCVHKSMSGLHKSRCPICRNHYYHFPYICQTLHLLLLKMYPVAYNRREIQTLDEEKDMGYSSPQINGPAHESLHEETRIKACNATRDVQSGSANLNVGLKNLLDFRQDIAATSVSTAKEGNSNSIHSNGTCNQVSVDDVLCGSCKHMLVRPTVLNCGHAFCACCIVLEINDVLKCGICQSLHPGGIPKVCLEFDHFLEKQFSKEYLLRRVTLQMKQDQLPCETPSACSSEAAKESSHFSFASGDDPSQWWNASSNVHMGVGCDSCGMYPIIGDRYRCKDCVEQVGYDLCRACYTTRSKLPGRFNQQHTPDHQFEIVQSNAMHSIMLTLLSGPIQEPSPVSNVVNDPSDDTTDDEDYMADRHLPTSESGPNEGEN